MQCQPHIRAAFGTVHRADGATVSLGDQLDDRKPKPGAAPSACVVRPAEPVERPREEGIVEPGPPVGDVQLDDAVLRLGEDQHLARAVRQRVLDQVVERLLEPVRVGIDDRRGRPDPQVSP